jgi:hypothetical protein
MSVIAGKSDISIGGPGLTLAGMATRTEQLNRRESDLTGGAEGNGSCRSDVVSALAGWRGYFRLVRFRVSLVAADAMPLII